MKQVRYLSALPFHIPTSIQISGARQMGVRRRPWNHLVAGQTFFVIQRLMDGNIAALLASFVEFRIGQLLKPFSQKLSPASEERGKANRSFRTTPSFTVCIISNRLKTDGERAAAGDKEFITRSGRAGRVFCSCPSGKDLISGKY